MIEWITSALGDLLVSIQTGYTPSTTNSSFFNGDIPWFTPSDVGSELWLTKSERTISKEGLFHGKAKLFEAGNILVTCIGNIGRVGILKQPASANQQITAIKFGEKVNHLYAYYWLIAHQYILERNANNAIVPILNNERLSTIKFYFPDSLPEQQRIAAILQKADRLRRLRRYARQLSDGYLQSVFLEMFGDPATNPKGWEIIESNRIILNIRYGTGSPPAYVEKGIPFLRATNVKNGTIETNGLVFISEIEARKISKCKLNEGDLLLVRSGVNSGDCALIPYSYQDAYAAYDLIIEMSFPYNYYFNFIINSDFGKNIISTLSRRAGQPHINSDQVKSIRLPLPPKALIEEFAEVIKKNEKFRGQQFETERQTEILFQSLLQRAFQGEL